MVIRLEVKNIKDDHYLSALLDILNRHYKMKVSGKKKKPHLSRTYEIRIEGNGEESFENDFMAFASEVGWLVAEQHHVEE
jgi:hypothetical protein